MDQLLRGDVATIAITLLLDCCSKEAVRQRPGNPADSYGEEPRFARVASTFARHCRDRDDRGASRCRCQTSQTDSSRCAWRYWASGHDRAGIGAESTAYLRRPGVGRRGSHGTRECHGEHQASLGGRKQVICSEKGGNSAVGQDLDGIALASSSLRNGRGLRKVAKESRGQKVGQKRDAAADSGSSADRAADDRCSQGPASCQEANSKCEYGDS